MIFECDAMLFSPYYVCNRLCSHICLPNAWQTTPKLYSWLEGAWNENTFCVVVVVLTTFHLNEQKMVLLSQYRRYLAVRITSANFTLTELNAASIQSCLYWCLMCSLSASRSSFSSTCSITQTVELYVIGATLVALICWLIWECASLRYINW